jgi:hypothetical protein
MKLQINFRLSNLSDHVADKSVRSTGYFNCFSWFLSDPSQDKTLKQATTFPCTHPASWYNGNAYTYTRGISGSNLDEVTGHPE